MRCSIKETEKILLADYFEWGKVVAEARQRLFNGADREKTLRELGHKLLPSKRGGASLLSVIQLRTMKNVYIEMQEAIKEARRTLELNVNHPDSDEARNCRWINLEKLCPWAITVFKHTEFKQIVSNKSPAYSAAEIIVGRLGQVLKTNITSGRSLQNRLQNVKPIVRIN